MNAPADPRACFIGDSLVAGVGDPECLGWVGRLCADATRDGIALTAYNLGVRRETSADIAKRWLAECAPRLPQHCQPHAVFSFGVNDTIEEGGRRRVAAADSVDHLRAILSAAKTRHATLMIGPPPVADASQNLRIHTLSQAFDLACRQIGVPYLPMFEALHRDPAWMRQVAENDGAHPRAEGYAAFARRVREWPAWWFGRIAA